MASRVVPRPPYVSPPKVDKPKRAGLQRKKPMRRVSKDRAKENRRNDQIHESFMQYNPYCACGCGAASEVRHHVASGTAGRDASLFDTDLQLALREFCHDSEFDDALVWPKARQLARKCVLIVQKFNAASANPVSLADVLKWIDEDEG